MPHTSAVIAELWRYLVKSMQGERLTAVPVGKRGLIGGCGTDYWP